MGNQDYSRNMRLASARDHIQPPGSNRPRDNDQEWSKGTFCRRVEYVLHESRGQRTACEKGHSPPYPTFA